MFITVHRRLVERGSFKHDDRIGRPAAVRTPDVEEAVLEHINEHPETSTRQLAQEFNVSSSTVWIIFKHNLLYRYHIRRVQVLLPTDFAQRLRLCRWIQEMEIANPYFLSQTLFTDECRFSR